eukprot:23245-Prorocentrum_lima.AAC.1
MVVEIGKISPITEVGADEEVVLARATRLKRDTVVEVVGMPGALSATTAMERMTSTTMTEKRSEGLKKSSSNLQGAAVETEIEISGAPEKAVESALGETSASGKATRSRLATEAVAAGMPVALSAITAMVHTTSTTTTARRSGVSRRSSSSLLGA